MDGLVLPENNPSISGIISGISKGSVWRDQTHLPGIVITYSYCVGGYGIEGEFGEYTDDELKLAFDRFLDEVRSRDEHWFEFSSENPEVYQRILTIFSDKKMETEMEYSFRRSEKYFEEEFIMSPHNQEVVIRRVDRFLLHKILNHEVANEEIFIERFLESWYSEGDFLRYSISFVALEGDRIVGIIFGSSAYHNVITIDIEVEETHRRQGIAEVMSKMMMNACADGGCILQWDCVESNEASMALVSKLAFTPFKQRPYYWMEIG